MKRILFICRYNRFRSQIAAAYFNKYCPKRIAISRSAGLIKGNSIGKEVKSYAKLNKLKLTLPKAMERGIVNNTDIFVIVANDVPPSIFSRYKKHGKQVKLWRIADIKEREKEVLAHTTETIRKKVMKLIEELK